MTHVFHRQLKSPMPVAVRGDGIELIDADGKRYIDASGGAAVSCLGHSHPRVIEAVRDQVGKLAYAHTSFFTSEPAEELADLMVESAPAGIDKVYYTSGGSEAVEAALKMARQFFLEMGEPERCHFIARWQSYHGNTLGALAVGGNRWRRAQFQPLLVDVQHVEPCYAYRGRRDGESDDAYVDRLIAELEATLARLGPETVIGFVCEPVVGATMGAVPALPGYLKRVKEVLDRHGILMILDEVMCGMGRTGTLYACEQDGVAPDLITVAKGLGAGYQPIGAVMVAQKIHDAIRDGSGFFQHGHTYIGHPTACAAALAVQKTIQDEQLLGAVKARGARFAELLDERFAEHPHVGDIRGRGLFRGLELVADRATKEPFPPATAVHAKLKKEAMARGLICYPGLGTIDGERGHHVLLAPPFITTDDQLATITDRLAAALDASLAGLARQAA